eukprot:4522176-Prymnesium_polylepis.1
MVLLPAADAAADAVALARVPQPPVHHDRVVGLARAAQPVERREAARLAARCALELDRVRLDELLRHAHVAERDVLRQQQAVLALRRRVLRDRLQHERRERAVLAHRAQHLVAGLLDLEEVGALGRGAAAAA